MLHKSSRSPRLKCLRLALSSLVLVASLSSSLRGQGRQLTQEPQPSPQSQGRLALVIGNGSYLKGTLKNPPNDALLMASALRDLGFDVTSGANKSQREMKQMMRDFGQRLRAKGGVGLFYFAGHGVQANGHNYLIPVDADIQTEADVEDQAVDLNYILSLMDGAQSALNIVILDACRNNPFGRSFRSTQDGLAQVKAPSGTLIAYATAPDSIAADGSGVNSPYTEELVKQLHIPGVLVETMFRRVTEQVSQRSGGKQEPWFSTNVKGDFYFHRRDEATTGDAVTNLGPRTAPATNFPDPDSEFWNSIKNSSDGEDFRAYKRAFPNGRYVLIADNTLRRLETSRNPVGGSNTTGPPSKSSGSTPGNETGSDKSKRDEIARKNADIEDANRKTTEVNGIVAETFTAGNAALNVKNYDEAIRQFDAGLAADPSQAALLTNKAAALKARGVQRYNAAIMASNINAKASGLESAKADFRDAAQAANKAVDLGRAVVAATTPSEQQRQNANMYAALSVRAEAMRLFVSKADPSQAEAGMRAFQEYIAVETDAAKKSKAQLNLAQMLLDAGAGDKAYAEYRKILAATPDDPEANLGAGLALYSTGDKAKYQESANYFQHFVDIAPDNHKFKADVQAILIELKNIENVVPEKTAPRRGKRP